MMRAAHAFYIEVIIHVDMLYRPAAWYGYGYGLGYDSRFGCVRHRIQISDEPSFGVIAKSVFRRFYYSSCNAMLEGK